MTPSDPSTGVPLGLLRPISPSPRSEQALPPKEPLTVLPSLSPVETKGRRVLDFDVETVAAGFADPQWVPNTVTCWAYAWTDEGTVVCEALAVADFYDLDARRRFLLPLLEAIDNAGCVTGHNLIRFDLPILNAECLRLGLPTLAPVLTQDTIRLPSRRGSRRARTTWLTLWV